MGEKMFALEADFHATQGVLPLAVIKCFTKVVFNWLIHAFVKPNLHVDSARLEEGGIVLGYGAEETKTDPATNVFLPQSSLSSRLGLDTAAIRI